MRDYVRGQRGAVLAGCTTTFCAINNKARSFGGFARSYQWFINPCLCNHKHDDWAEFAIKDRILGSLSSHWLVDDLTLSHCSFDMLVATFTVSARSSL